MDSQTAVDLGREAMFTALLLGAPVLIAGMVAGLVIGLLQALTQIQEQTVAFVPKVVVMMLAFSLTLPWLIDYFVEYARGVIENVRF